MKEQSIPQNLNLMFFLQRDEIQPFEKEDSELYKGMNTEDKALPTGDADNQSSSLLPAGSLIKSNSRNGHEESPLAITMDEQCDSRAKSPIAVVEV